MQRSFLIPILLFSTSALAQSPKTLEISGRVNEKISVQLENGEMKVTKNSPYLKVVVVKRQPASVIKVEAP